jgi:hypothetical protein
MINKKDRIEAAIRHIQTATDVDPWAIELAVDALQKQIPKKPKRVNKNDIFDGNWRKICPTCGKVLMERITTNVESYPRHYNMSGFCWCGQAIDWGTEK